jgi:hypothetical protein
MRNIVFDKHVALPHESLKQFLASLRLEVHANASLVSVHAHEVRALVALKWGTECSSECCNAYTALRLTPMSECRRPFLVFLPLSRPRRGRPATYCVEHALTPDCLQASSAVPAERPG